MNPQLLAAIAFWRKNMALLRPREIPTSMHNAPLFISYSDGEGEGAGVGVALWCPDGKVVGGLLEKSQMLYARCGHAVLNAVIITTYLRSKPLGLASSSTISVTV